MSSRFPFFLTLVLTHFIWLWDANAQPAEGDDIRGAVIVVDLLEPVRFLDQEKNPLQAKVKVGSLVPVGHYAQAGAGGRMVILLSNGTLLTLKERTKMRIGTFEQEPFDPKGRKVSDLEGEPSVSQVEIELDWGDLVVKTKKLNKGSSLSITSATGTAGVRGTEFQISENPGQGMQLDVTESTVAFTPPGGQTIPVSQGQGVDVSSAGVVAPRPVNPVVAESIAVTNQAATQVSGEISMGAVSDAMNGQAVESLESGAGLPEIEPLDSGTEENLPPQEEEQEDSGDSKEGSGSSMREALDQGSVPEVKIDDVLEQSFDLKQTRESGEELGVSAKDLARFDLNDLQLKKFLEFTEEVQRKFIAESPQYLAQLLDLSGFELAQAESFLSYNKATREIIVLLEEEPMMALLNQALDQSVIRGSLNPDSVAQSAQRNLPGDDKAESLDEKALEVADLLRTSGNSELYQKILEEMDGEPWSEDWIKTAKVANQLSQDYILPNQLDELVTLSAQETFDNPFFLEVSSLYGRLSDDSMDLGDNPVVFGGKGISLGSGTYDWSSRLSDGALLIGASETLELKGELMMSSGDGGDARMVLMSGDSINVAQGTKLSAVLSDLVVAARADVLMQDVALESAREVAIRSLRNIELQQVKIHADSMVRMKASRELNVNGLELSQKLPSLILEATTIRLRNVDFPSSTAVQLNSLKGPIDGKYPNFGTQIPMSSQLGRVNFLENVKSGGNLLKDRMTFDQFGGNISIGK
ncbi:MAG: FecR family protein, partial [Verrucomicrobiota bacterium]|nr:FecR family protein [Verrucomicrobiota bacterium]